MALQDFILVLLTGIVGAGLAHSFWQWMVDEVPSIWCLARHSVLMPVKVLGLIFAAPFLMLRAGRRVRGGAVLRVPFLASVLAFCGAWCFMLGIVILGSISWLAAGA